LSVLGGVVEDARPLIAKDILVAQDSGDDFARRERRWRWGIGGGIEHDAGYDVVIKRQIEVGSRRGHFRTQIGPTGEDGRLQSFILFFDGPPNIINHVLAELGIIG